MEIEVAKIKRLEQLIKIIKSDQPLSKKEMEDLSDISASLLFLSRASLLLD